MADDFKIDYWSPEELTLLKNLGEYFAAGFLSENLSIEERMANGIDELLSNISLPVYNGEILYPCGNQSFWPCSAAMHLHYVSVRTNAGIIKEKIEKASGFGKKVLEKYYNFLNSYPQPGGYTHCAVNYGRFIKEGLPSYKKRIEKAMKIYENDSEKRAFLRGCLAVVNALAKLIGRFVSYLESLRFDDPIKEKNRSDVLDHYKSMLTKPAYDFFSAADYANFPFCIDGCDGFGRFDVFMYDFYRIADKGEEVILQYIKRLWMNIDETSSWNVAIGGSDKDRRPYYNELTRLCIRAAKGLRRPNLALRIRADMPQDIWDEALDCISSGNGLPALYGEETYLKNLESAHLNLAYDDITDFCFGGCTETMVYGCSNVGSLDADINPLQILEGTIHKYLSECISFDDFYNRYKADLKNAIRNTIEYVNRNQKAKALYHPQMIRSLFADDCIESGINFSAGGARYNWSVVNCMGLSNPVDSLMNIKRFVFDGKTVPGKELTEILSNNFKDNEELRQRFLNSPKFGNGDAETDKLAHELSAFIYNEIGLYAPYRGGRFLPSCIMFVTYEDFGRPVGATPDGRPAAAPIADSCGAMQGRDKKGPTALLASALSLDQRHAAGTLVLNLRISKQIFDDPEGRVKLRKMISAYLLAGGQQIQINVLDAETLKKALDDPEEYPNLIVRMGGYSEFFARLSRELKLSVIERTEHTI